MSFGEDESQDMSDNLVELNDAFNQQNDSTDI